MARRKTVNHSPKFETVKNYYINGLWSEARVRKAVEKGWITEAECREILEANKSTENV